jgi:Domain of unknown function (DUF4149)
MERAFAVVEAVALGLWVGALAGFAFVFAPASLMQLGDATQFGSLVGAVLARLNLLGYLCGAVALLSVFVRSREDESLGRGSARRALLLVAMLVLVVIEAQVVFPAVHAAQGPMRERLHDLSTLIYGLVMLLGVVALALSVLARPEAMRPRSLR